MALVTEDQVELKSSEWFKELGYQYDCGYDIAVDGETPERTDYRSVVLKDRLLSALTRINSDIPKSADRHGAVSTDEPQHPCTHVVQSSGAFVVNQRGEGHLSGRQRDRW